MLSFVSFVTKIAVLEQTKLGAASRIPQSVSKSGHTKKLITTVSTLYAQRPFVNSVIL